jgi:copper chaperone
MPKGTPVTSRTYTVTGMTCGHCVSSVTEEVGAVPGVAGVDVDLDSGRLLVTADAPLDDAAILAAVAEAGYQATP